MKSNNLHKMRTPESEKRDTAQKCYSCEYKYHRMNLKMISVISLKVYAGDGNALKYILIQRSKY